MKHLIYALILCGSFINVNAQKTVKFDTLYMRSGETKIGSVTEIADDAVKFTHKGETLGYSFKKADISKIGFSSGRTETFATPVQEDTSAKNAAPAQFVNQQDHRNNVAVLPFSFISDQRSGDDEMGFKIQEECYTYLSKKAQALKIQDPSSTNAFLGKAGVNSGNFRTFTYQELCNILGVEYILRGTVTMDKGSVSTYGNAGSNTTYNSNNKDGKSKSSSSTYGSATTSQDYKTSVTMEVYMDDGKKVFGQNHDAFWSTTDAYKSTLQYLLKRTPIYNR